MNRTILLLLFIFCSITGYSQTLSLYSQNKVKIFKPGSYYELISASNHNDCEWTKYYASISKVGGDSLTLQVKRIESSGFMGPTAVRHTRDFAEPIGPVMLAHQDIMYLRHYKSGKAQNRRESMLAIGGVMILTGALTIVHSLLVNDRPSSNLLLASGGLQFGVGLALAVSSDSHKYYLQNHEDVWQIKPPQ